MDKTKTHIIGSLSVHSMMAESQLVESTVPGSALLSENLATNSVGGTASASTSSTRTTAASTNKRFGIYAHKRHCQANKKLSSSLGDVSIASSSMELNREAVPGAMPVFLDAPNHGSDGDTELDVQNNRPLCASGARLSIALSFPGTSILQVAWGTANYCV